MTDGVTPYYRQVGTDNYVQKVSIEATQVVNPGTVASGAAAPTNSAAQGIASASNRRSITLYNNGSVTVYLGIDNTLTTSNGFPLLPQASFTIEATVAIWMVTASGTGDVRYWGERV